VQIDYELAIRLQNDDIEAFNTLYWTFHAAIYANALKLTRDTVIAEDIVQEVFITLWEKRKSIDPNHNINGWLFTVSYNKSVDQLKRKLKSSLAHKDSQASIDNSTDVIDDLSEEQLSMLEKAMKQLSPQKCKVFQLCKIQGKTYEEAARELQISKFTVKEYLSSAVTIIKEYIRQHPEHWRITSKVYQPLTWILGHPITCKLYHPLTFDSRPKIVFQ
jgi:RNA polymerase sigma-70 factor (family 1)